MNFVKFESRHDMRQRNTDVWVNGDLIESVSVYPKQYMLRLPYGPSKYMIEKSVFNREQLKKIGVELNE